MGIILSIFLAIAMASNPTDVLTAWKIDTGANSITTSAYDELEDSTTQRCLTFMASNRTSSHILIATGAAAAEVDKWVIPPSGGFATLHVNVASGTRISVTALDADATTGWVVIQCYY